jgi:exonuclease III
MDMRLSAWNVGSLETEARNLAKYNSDLAAVQEVRWDKVRSEPTDIYFSMKF